LTATPGLPVKRCETLAAALDIDVFGVGVCLACLSFVSFPLDDGDEARARRAARRMAPDLWDDGLAEPLLEALERARDDGVPDAEAAWLDVQTRGPRSATVRAVVLRLATDLVEYERTQRGLMGAARARLPLAPPDFN
jgi:hypothetical protein